LKAIVDGIGKIAFEPILPFEDEILGAKGSVNVTVAKDLKSIDYQFENLPVDLVERIRQAVHAAL
jgi:hypothetical protein